MSKKQERDSKRVQRQLKVDFDSIEDLQDFKDLADELGVSYSQLARLFIEHGKADTRDGKLDLARYLIASKLPWLRDKDIDIDKFKEDRSNE
jgi:hypothetical protein